MEPINLRTPSYIYNHGGYYAPVNPRDCNTPGGPCSCCQDRINEEDAALAAAGALLALSQQPPCCADRPAFLEPCPDCNGTYVTHASRGFATCNGCPDKVCGNCFGEARYFCPLRKLLPPPAPLVRQMAIGVQSPKPEEKRENK